MLKIEVKLAELWDAEKQEFSFETFDLELEHSLVSLSKWESIFEKPFLGDGEKSSEEIIAYIKAMVLTPEVPEKVFHMLSEENYQEINAYLDAKHTATTFFDQGNQGRSRETVTSELIYYWMITFQVPFECERWPLNRLMTLIKICSVKSQKPKKMSRSELAARNRQLNEQRRAKLGTKG